MIPHSSPAVQPGLFPTAWDAKNSRANAELDLLGSRNQKDSWFETMAKAKSVRNPRGRGVKIHLSQAMISRCEQGVDLVLKRMQLSMGSPRSLLGSRVLAENSEKQASVHHRGLMNFAMAVGDFESMIMLSENAPEGFCPSIAPSLMADYISWKTTSSKQLVLKTDGQVLVNFHTKDPITGNTVSF